MNATATDASTAESRYCSPALAIEAQAISTMARRGVSHANSSIQAIFSMIDPTAKAVTENPRAPPSKGRAASSAAVAAMPQSRIATAGSTGIENRPSSPRAQRAMTSAAHSTVAKADMMLNDGSVMKMNDSGAWANRER